MSRYRDGRRLTWLNSEAALVEYDQVSEAQEAVRMMNSGQIDGHEVVVVYAASMEIPR